MAKKKGGKKKGGSTRYREGARTASGRPRQIPRRETFKPPKGPRSQTLPGMDDVRSRKLDNICEAIGDCRERINAARSEEAQLDASALQAMVKAGKTVYRHGGIELARIPGAEKLRVRVTKETGDAGDEDLEQPEEGEAIEAEDHEAAAEDAAAQG